MDLFRSCLLPLTFIFVLASTQFAHSQWQNLIAPFGGSVLQFDEDESDLYALTYGGIYKSTDAGANWSLAGNSRHLGRETMRLEVSAGIMYVLTQTGTIERSTDGGTTWTTVLKRPYLKNGPGEQLLYIFAIGDTVLVGSVLTIYRSINQGTTWEKTFDNYANRYFGFAKVGNDIFAAHDWFIHKSSDGGLTWEQVFSASYVFADFTTVDTVLYALYDGYPRLIRSYDRGESWDKIDADSIQFYQYNNETRDWLTGFGQDIFYASDYWCEHGGVVMFQSPDGGDEWFTAKRQGISRHGLRDLKALSGQLLAGTLQGVFHSTDKGDTFSTHHKGMNATWVYYLLKTGNSRWWAVTRQGVFSSDDGTNWQLRFSGELEKPCHYMERPLIKTGKRIFYRDITNDCETLYSEDNGDTWLPLSIGPTWFCPQMSASTSAVWFADSDQQFKWDDSDNAPMVASIPAQKLKKLHIANNTMYLEGDDNQYVSHDMGEKWDILPPLLVDSIDFGGDLISLDNDAVFYRVRIYSSQLGFYSQLYSLQFSEKIWQPHIALDALTGDTLSELNDSWDIEFLKKEGGLYWMGIHGRGLYYSADKNAETWYPFEPKLPFIYPTDLVLDSQNLWVGTSGAGIYRKQLNTLPPGKNLPMFSLFPNPSVSKANLVADVFFTEPFRLRIFDAVGRLVSETEMPPGYYWQPDLDYLPTGMYLWQIQTTYGSTVLKWVKSK